MDKDSHERGENSGISPGLIVDKEESESKSTDDREVQDQEPAQFHGDILDNHDVFSTIIQSSKFHCEVNPHDIIGNRISGEPRDRVHTKSGLEEW